MEIKLNNFDFVDFGCSSAGSMRFAQNKLGGTRGLGLDIDPKKVEASINAGFEALVADVRQLDPQQLGTVRFVVMSHFLEHLPWIEEARACINSACAIADKYVLIRQPFFDADDYLSALGLKLFWSDWHGHKTHMKIDDFHNALSALLTRRKICRYLLFNRTRIYDSDDPCIHPLSSPKDQHQWEKETHSPKPYYRFQRRVYREVGALIYTRARKLDEKPRRFLLSCDLMYDSNSD